MVDINKFVGSLKEKGQKIHKGFDSMTNYYTMFDYIKNAKNIGFIGHDNIDGDSLGSILAIQQWIKNKFNDKKLTAYTNGKPGAVFDFLEADIKSGKDLKLDEDIDLFIILDSSDFGRLGELYDNNKEKIESTNIINIDHHESNNKYGTINIVDITAPATAQVVYDVLSALENKVNNLINQTKIGFDKKVANYILLGILADTQVFFIPRSNEKTLFTAANLIKKGADKDYLIDNLFKNKDVEQLKLEGIIFDRIKILEQNGVKFCYSYYMIEDLEKLGLDTTDSSIGKGIATKLTNLNNIDFAVLGRIRKNEVRLSFRSKIYDVNSLAQKLGGGGHRKSAGARIKENMTFEELEIKILSII